MSKFEKLRIVRIVGTIALLAFLGWQLYLGYTSDFSLFDHLSNQ